jgi:menaquinone-specific isochorismate synthase
VEPGHGRTDQRTQERLVVRTIPIADPGDLLGALPEPAALAWIRHGDGLVAWGEAARITLPAGEDRFTAGEKWLREFFDGANVDDQVGLPGCGPVAFGSFTFDSASDGSVLVVPSTVIGRRGGQSWLTTIGQGTFPNGQVNAAPPGAAVRSWPNGDGRFDQPLSHNGSRPINGAAYPGQPVAGPSLVRWHDGSLAAPDWELAVAAAVRRIRAGELRKVVLARDLYATASTDIDPRLLLGRLAARYPDCYTFACAGLVGATPELLIRRQDTDISCLVLAGTAPRGRDAAEDAVLGASLLTSEKDTEEHGYAVAGVRTALAMLCEELVVDSRPSLLRLANVQHLATGITGRLTPGRDGTEHSVLTLAAALHPTGAVCGTPTEAAMELIRELEGMDRGRYAGPVGWIDACGNGEWGIALRCAEIDGPRARLFAGCGIVAGSEPAAELAEAQAKFSVVQFALES